jgi:ketosteroid isomerase-like protein
MQTMDVLATQVRLALESADLTVMGELLAPDARWGAPEQKVPTCRNSQQILQWYEAGKNMGVRADVTEMVVIDTNIVVGLHRRARPDVASNAQDVRWQVLSVKDGRIAEIRGYETRHEATEFATTGVSNWRK